MLEMEGEEGMCFGEVECSEQAKFSTQQTNNEKAFFCGCSSVRGGVVRCS